MRIVLLPACCDAVARQLMKGTQKKRPRVCGLFLAALERHGIALVDVVVVNLYPFLDAAAKSDTPFHEMIEKIDIGGPSLVRAAAKNFADVLVVVDPQDYGRLLDALDSTPTLQFRFDLMRKAIAHTAAYDTAIADTLAHVRIEGARFERT